MRIAGQLRDDILNGKAVLFLGAGVSQAAGLYGGQDLANYLYELAGAPEEYGKHRRDLSRLAAKLDKDPQFTRRWIDKHLVEYFLTYDNYKTLEHHKKIFQLRWKAIFTTNFDISLEIAEHFVDSRLYRLVPTINPNERAMLDDSDAGKLKYFKIHGCCRELEQRPSTAPSLVITQGDFQASIARNELFFDCLRRYAYDCSIIFIGFQANRVENNPILATVQEATSSISALFHQQFKPFAILKDVDEDTVADLEEIRVNVLEGTFEEFIDTALLLKDQQERRIGVGSSEEKVYIKAAHTQLELTRSEHLQYASQFTLYHETFWSEKAAQTKELSLGKVVDLWKSEPSDAFQASGRYITRPIFADAVKELKSAVVSVSERGTPHVMIVEGDRGSGKSVLVRQLGQYAYEQLEQPVIVLCPQASYVEKPKGSLKEIDISGWDARLMDKLLSFFYTEAAIKGDSVVPILVADHLSYRQLVLDHLLKYLENHGKPCLLILTLNTVDWNSAAGKDRLQLYEHSHLHIEQKLQDEEVTMLFDKISKDNTRMVPQKDFLIGRAKSAAECNRDILFILYVWFDREFRKLEDIISEEVEKLVAEPTLKDLYLSIAVFHQYNFSPRVSLCAEACGLDISRFTELRGSPAFKAFINTSVRIDDASMESASTRHAEFSRQVVERLMETREQETELMAAVLEKAGPSDLQFVRDFMNYVYRYNTSFTLDQVEKLKKATEKRLGRDYVLNHQYAAFLIRENVSLEDARYYLDAALDESDGGPMTGSIIHSMGNFYFTLYKTALEDGLNDKANEYYDYAKDLLSRSRTLRNNRDEHGYYTDIDLTKHRVACGVDNVKERTLLKAEGLALTIEALRVIPAERQNLLRTLIGQEVPFDHLPDREKNIIIDEINNGKASPILLEYYGEHLLRGRTLGNWQRLSRLVSKYRQKEDDAGVITIVGILAKRGFILNANTRFEMLRGFYDNLVRYGESKINFALLAEYVRLLLVDALVLQKYEFLRSVMNDITELFREYSPRFLRDEYVLSRDRYNFDEADVNLLPKLFGGSEDFYTSKNARRFSTVVNLAAVGEERYFRIELDPITRYWIKGLRKEIGSRSGQVELSFSIKYTHEGFLATDYRT